MQTRSRRGRRRWRRRMRTNRRCSRGSKPRSSRMMRTRHRRRIRVGNRSCRSCWSRWSHWSCRSWRSCHRWMANIPGISTISSQMISRPTTEALILKRAILGLMTSLLTRATRLWLATMIDLTREVENADDLRNLAGQLNTNNPNTRLNLLEIRMNLTLTL